MTVTSTTGQKAAPAQGRPAKLGFAAAAKTLLSGSTSLWGTAATVTLLGGAAKKGPATYNAQALLKQVGVNLTDDQKKKLAESDRSIQQFENATKSSHSERKNMARQKIEQLKERLKQLLAMGGDPKLVARQAAQLARELKEAVKEYGAASAGLSAPSVARAPADADAAAVETAAGQAEAGGGAPNAPSAQVEGVQAKAASAEAATGAQVQPAKRETAPETENGPPPKHSAAKDRAGLDDQRRAEMETAKVEREFIKEIKKLAKLIKALFEQSKAKAEKEKGPDADLAEDEKVVRGAMKGIEKVLKELEEGLRSVGSDQADDTELSAAVDPSLAAAPVGSIVSVLA